MESHGTQPHIYKSGKPEDKLLGSDPHNTMERVNTKVHSLHCHIGLQLRGTAKHRLLPCTCHPNGKDCLTWENCSCPTYPISCEQVASVLPLMA